MQSSTIIEDEFPLRAALEQEIVVQRRRAQAPAESVRGREALKMRELIDDFEDLSFMRQADMRRIRNESMHRQESWQMQAHRRKEEYELLKMHKEETYHRQQQTEAIQRTAALRSARENMQQNAVAAGRFHYPLAAGYLNTNVAGFSDVTRNRILLHEQGLRERALVSAHAERMRIDALQTKRNGYR